MTGFLNVTGADFAAVAPEIVLCLAGSPSSSSTPSRSRLRAFFPYVALVAPRHRELRGRARDRDVLLRAPSRSRGLHAVRRAPRPRGASPSPSSAAPRSLARDKRDQGEFYALLLWSAAGLMLMVKGADLLVVFIGLELMSLALYVLAAWYRDVPAGDRGRDEVLPDGGPRVGVPPLRRRDDLRAPRVDAARDARRASPRRPGAGFSTRCSRSASSRSSRRSRSRSRSSRSTPGRPTSTRG